MKTLLIALLLANSNAFADGYVYKELGTDGMMHYKSSLVEQPNINPPKSSGYNGIFKELGNDGQYHYKSSTLEPSTYNSPKQNYYDENK